MDEHKGSIIMTALVVFSMIVLFGGHIQELGNQSKIIAKQEEGISPGENGGQEEKIEQGGKENAEVNKEQNKENKEQNKEQNISVEIFIDLAIQLYKFFKVALVWVITILAILAGNYYLYKYIRGKGYIDNLKYNIGKKRELFTVRKYEGIKTYGIILDIMRFNRRNGIKYVDKEIKEIVKKYKGSPKDYGIKMYKYEKTFEELLKTLKKAKRDGVLEEEMVKNMVEKVISYPYKEIVGEGIASKVVEGLEEELKILNDLGKNNINDK